MKVPEIITCNSKLQLEKKVLINRDSFGSQWKLTWEPTRRGAGQGPLLLPQHMEVPARVSRHCWHPTQEVTLIFYTPQTDVRTCFWVLPTLSTTEAPPSVPCHCPGMLLLFLTFSSGSASPAACDLEDTDHAQLCTTMKPAFAPPSILLPSAAHAGLVGSPSRSPCTGSVWTSPHHHSVHLLHFPSDSVP